MPRAVREICDLAFDTYDIECIYAEVFSGNPASCRVLEKAGFTREGVKRRGVYKNGRVMDGVLHTLLRGE
jgi:ribosomal-protein-alanine N-acetyltransferase